MATVITTTSPPAPPFPLPDLPRAPDSDLSRLACAVLERRDFGALTRLPDMLRDMGRDADAEEVMAIVAKVVRPVQSPHDVWQHIRNGILSLLFYDLFSWEQCVAVLAKRFDPPSGKGGTISVGGVNVPIRQWEPNAAINIPSFESSTAQVGGLVEGTLTISGTFDLDATTAAATVAELHAAESHPDYEYAVALGPPPGPGWAINGYRSAVNDGPGTVHWMRPRA